MSQFLVEKGADINISCENGNTPVHMAFKNGNKFLILYLKKNGADFNHVNFDNMTPLCFGSYALLEELDLLNGFAVLNQQPFREKFNESHKKHKSIHKLKIDHHAINTRVSLFLQRNSHKPKNIIMKENFSSNKNLFMTNNLNYRLQKGKTIFIDKKKFKKQNSMKSNKSNHFKTHKKNLKEIKFENLIKEKKKALRCNDMFKFENNFVESSYGVDDFLIKKLPKVYNPTLLPDEEYFYKKLKEKKTTNLSKLKVQKQIE